MDYLQSYQLDIMLVLTGILVLLLFFSIAIRNLSNTHRFGFVALIASATLLLLADRYAYIYRGDESELGFWMVRICNFLTYAMTIAVIFFYNHLLKSMISENTKEVPVLLRVVDGCCAGQLLLLVISQFTGLFYSFDETNHYQRSPYGFISFILPMGSLVLQLVASMRYHDRFGKKIRLVVHLFCIAPLAAAALQVVFYGFSLINITVALMVIVLYVIALNDMNIRAEKTETVEMDHLRDQQERMERLLDQTTTTLITALDAKEAYTQGHSARVAKYARQIAEYVGKDEKECDEIYYAGLLHDIGKIGIPDEIINKKGKLTPEEYEIMKQHPTLGRQILSGITEMPYLAIGANFHHERFDGTGYPEGLAGEDIPELGRILAVADAYDAMSSHRSYRDAIPQQKIREEFIKYSGTQFDPRFAKIMQHLIDLDSEYQMKEKTDAPSVTEETVIHCETYRERITDGMLVTPDPTVIRLVCDSGEGGMPSLVLFDSLDAKVYTEEPLRTDMNYFEYGEIRFDGETVVSGARKMQTDERMLDRDQEEAPEDDSEERGSGTPYEITAVRYRDHAMFTVRSSGEAGVSSTERHVRAGEAGRDDSDVRSSGDQTREIRVIVALPDNTRFLYVGITGEKCSLRSIDTEKTGRTIGENHIPRIAEEISYIKGPAGDVPNVQIDGYRTDATEGIPIQDGLELRFHTMSLPTARLVWHTAFIDIFTSDNKMINGPNYKEFALIRLDGEYWDDSGGLSENLMEVAQKDAFTGWDDWKENNKKGMDCTVRFLRRDNRITTMTENAGIAIRNITKLHTDVEELYVALSGDQVALTQIRIDVRPMRKA